MAHPRERVEQFLGSQNIHHRFLCRGRRPRRPAANEVRHHIIPSPQPSPKGRGRKIGSMEWRILANVLNNFWEVKMLIIDSCVGDGVPDVPRRTKVYTSLAESHVGDGVPDVPWRTK